MRLLKIIALFFALIGTYYTAEAQKSVQDSSIAMGFLNIVYNGAVPSGDLSSRFGYTNLMGMEGGFKFSSNFYAYTGMKFIFGKDVRENVASNIVQLIGSPTNGYQPMALGSDGRFYQVRFWERGFTVPLVFGKIFRLPNSKNYNSGIFLELGGQFIQHRIQIIPVGNSVPNLDKPYLKGYDRLTNGLGLVQGIGYRHFGNNRFTNFMLGLEASQNFTQNRRDLNYDTGVKDETKRLDLLFGFKAAWTFPIYKSAPEKEYYY